MLREMTGAPDLNKPLLKEEIFEEKPVRSARPVWKLPVPKLPGIVGIKYELITDFGKF
jgi:hypothetical protein